MKNSIIVVAFILIATMSKSQNTLSSLSPSDSEKIKQQAESFLKTLTDSANRENYKLFGFNSVESISLLSVEKSCPSLIITLEDLKKYKVDENPLLLIKSVNRASCILKNRNTDLIESILDLEKSKESWMIKGFANTDIPKAFNKIEKSILQMNLSLVRIPSLNLFFAAFNDPGNKLQFVSLQENSFLKINMGEAKEASAILEQLVPVANNYNGLPW